MACRLAEAIVDRCPDAVRQGLARVTYAVFEAERSLSKYSRSRPPRRGAQWKPGAAAATDRPHRASASPEIAASSLPAEKMSCRSEIMTPHPASSLEKKRAGGRRRRPKCLRPSENPRGGTRLRDDPRSDQDQEAGPEGSSERGPDVDIARMLGSS